MSSQRKRVRPVASTPPPETRHRKKTRVQFQDENSRSVPTTQQALLLNAIREPYEVIFDQPTPDVQREDEILVRVEAIGLNPIDWKAPDYNFGIPVLPYIAGRELAGIVVKATSSAHSRIKEGDTVIVPSTDYRDLRKAAYQEYSISASFNAIRLPQSISKTSGSILGVAFVSAALALGICMGLNFEKVEHGPDLLSIVRKIDPEKLPLDIKNECLQGISSSERAREGDYLVIWGGSATCAHVAKQLARLAGLKIISVTDSAKHGLRLSSIDAIRADLIVDSHNPDRAIEVIKATTGGHARFGLDMQGKDTATHLLHSLQTPAATGSAEPKDVPLADRSRTTLPSPPSTPLEKLVASQKSHLVGMTGLPKSNIPDGVVLHNVPIKLFHEIPEVGEALSAWCERLLAKGRLQPPDVIGTVEGLSGINGGLDRMRRREISGGRLVAVLE